MIQWTKDCNLVVQSLYDTFNIHNGFFGAVKTMYDQIPSWLSSRRYRG